MPLTDSENGGLENETHVWFCRPDKITDALKLDEYLSILSADEREKWQRFHSAKDQHSYLVSHALVRRALSMYCDVAPEQWSFTFNQHGKPEISGEQLSKLNCPPIKFNLSHTEGLSACVVSLDDECGVDVENIHRKNKLSSIARRMFAEPELATMRDISDHAMRKKFFDYWTLREAYVKTLGTGLSGSSKQFYFEIKQQGSTERVAEICFANSVKNPGGFWQFSLLQPSAEHTIAVALRSADAAVKSVVFQEMLP